MDAPVRTAFLLVVLVAGGSACSTAAPPAVFGTEPIQVLPSRSQTLSIAVRTAPQPPTRGDQRVEFTITDAATSAPSVGLTLRVVPWMPVMDHGTSVVPSVSETKPGTYIISNVDLFMAGEWELRTTITGAPDDAGGDAGITSDYVSPSFEIP